ncbi:MAG: hypothetical protein IT370_33015 [Deltaproteobacteria bacterium]|nr:hypothetical protein [Deltaproteobacteria bacterium]
MARRARATCIALTLAALTAAPGRARGYDFEVDSTVLGQGYQVRQVRLGGDRLLNRRRLLGSLRLGVWNLLARGAHGRGPTLSFASNLRYGADFGDYLEQAALDATPELEAQQRQLDVMYAYLDGQGFWGRVDFRAGRQVTVDGLDWFAFDGLTVRVRTPALPLLVEASGGLEARAAREELIAAPAYGDVGGTSAERALLSPTIGAALELAGPRWAAARLSYRRTTSAGATGDEAVDRDLATLGLDDDQLVRAERLTLSGRAWLLGGRLQPYAGARFDALRRSVDQRYAGVSARVTAAHTLRADYQNALPSWDGDSIFNVFTQYPYDDLRVAWDGVLAACWRAELRGTARWFHHAGCDGAAGCDAPSFDIDLGGGAALEWSRRRGHLRGDGWYSAGGSGRSAGLDLSGAWKVRWRLGRGVDAGGGDSDVQLDGRLTLQAFEDALRAELEGVSFGAQVGVGWPIRPGLSAHIWVEDNISRFYDSALRVVGVLDLEVLP